MRLCIVCKQPIEDERIDAIPATKLCAAHGEEIEAFGGEFKVSASQERTSKQGSMKMNYGGISTSSVRNDEALERLLDDYERRQFED